MSLFNNKPALQQAIHKHSTEPINRLLLHPDSGIAVLAGQSSRPTGIVQLTNELFALLGEIVSTVENIATAGASGVISNFFSNLWSNEIYVDVQVRSPAGSNFWYYNVPLVTTPAKDKGASGDIAAIKAALKDGHQIYVKLMYDGGKPSAAIATATVVNYPSAEEATKDIRYPNASGNIFEGTPLAGAGSFTFGGLTGSNDPVSINQVLGKANSNSFRGINLSPEFMASWNMKGDYTIINTVQAAGQRLGVYPALIMAVIKTESSCRPSIVSSAGAQGLMQLMPSTFSEYYPQTLHYVAGIVNNAFDPVTNIWVGSLYLGLLIQQFGGDYTKAVAAYNAGPGAVTKYGGIPPFVETQNYVKTVMSNLNKVIQETARQNNAKISSRPEITNSDQTGASSNVGRTQGSGGVGF